MVQAKLVLFELDQFGLKSGALDSGRRKWVVSNMTGTWPTVDSAPEMEVFKFHTNQIQIWC
jgi:hypothetical protein